MSREGPVPGHSGQLGRGGSPSNRAASASTAPSLEHTRSGGVGYTHRPRTTEDLLGAPITPRRPSLLSRIKSKSSLRVKKSSAPSEVPAVPTRPLDRDSLAPTPSRRSLETPSLGSSSVTGSTGRQSPITPHSPALSGPSPAFVTTKGADRLQSDPASPRTTSCARPRTRPRPAVTNSTRRRPIRVVRRHCSRPTRRS